MTFLEVARQLTIVLGIVVLVALDASLGAFFWTYWRRGS